MSEILAIQFVTPARLSSDEVKGKHEFARIDFRETECLSLVTRGIAVPVMVDEARVAGGLARSPVDGLPTHFLGYCKKYEKKLTERAIKRAAISAEAPPKGKSWLNVEQEEGWAKLCAKREGTAAARAEARLKIIAIFNETADREEVEALARLASARANRERAARAAEIVSSESATRELKIARDTEQLFRETNDPRAAAAAERLAVAEQKFAEAELAKNRYEWRGRTFAASAKIAELKRAHANGQHYFPAARLASLVELEAAAAATLASDDFAALESFLSEIGTLLELSGPGMAGFRGGIAGAIT